MKQLTKEQIILETLDYYSEDPMGKRGIDCSNGHCLYLTNDGKMCAFGRIMKNPKRFLGDSGITVDGIYKKMNGRLDILLKDEYKGHDKGFWSSLQFFHDNSLNWDLENNTISSNGEKRVLDLLNTYAN